MSDEMKKAALASLMGIGKPKAVSNQQVKIETPKEATESIVTPKLASVEKPKSETKPRIKKERVPQALQVSAVPKFEPVSNFVSPYYKGKGLYERKDGQAYKKVGLHLRPDQHKALQMAKARGDDSRGTTIEEIIRTLLDEAGYKE